MGKMVEKVAWEVDGKEIQREREGGRINSSKNLGENHTKATFYILCMYICMYVCIHGLTEVMSLG